MAGRNLASAMAATRSHTRNSSLKHKNRDDLFTRHFGPVARCLERRTNSWWRSGVSTEARLAERIWQATFSAAGGARAGYAGDGLMLCATHTATEPPITRTPPRPSCREPIINSYLTALPPGRVPRIVGSLSGFVAETRSEALRLADSPGKALGRFIERGHRPPGDSLADIIKAFDVHVGTPQSHRIRCWPTGFCRESPISPCRCTPLTRRMTGTVDGAPEGGRARAGWRPRRDDPQRAEAGSDA